MSQKLYLYVILLSIFLLGGMGCGGEKTSRPKDALACVDGECLTERDVEYQIPEAYRAAVTPEEKKDYVRQWIRNAIFYQEVKNQKFDQDKRIQSLVEQMVRNLVVKEFLEAKLKDKINVTDEEAMRYYQQNRQMFVWEDDFMRLGHIFTQKTAGITLADLLIKQGNKFEDVALRMSEDEKTKKRGGDVGLVRIQDLPPEMAEFAMKLKPNEISPPIQTSYGFEIIRITDRKQKGNPMEFEWAKEQIINTLASEQRQIEIDKILKQLSLKARIETFGWASDVKPLESK